MSAYRHLKLDEVANRDLYHYLTGAIGPRPIALTTTKDAEGRLNLAPFSYFNVFCSNPPTLVIGPNRSGRTGVMKDTGLNAKAHNQLTISLVNYDMVEQMNLSSAPFDHGVNEYERSGFTPEQSHAVDVPFVAEAPIAFECKVRDIYSLGEDGGSGDLVICTITHMHIKEAVLATDDKGMIDPHKLDIVGRHGWNWYFRERDGLFEINRPMSKDILGWDGLPEHVCDSKVLSGNNLGRLGLIENFPDDQAVNAFLEAERAHELAGITTREDAHRQAIKHLEKHDVEHAWLVILAAESLLDQ